MTLEDYKKKSNYLREIGQTAIAEDFDALIKLTLEYARLLNETTDLMESFITERTAEQKRLK